MSKVIRFASSPQGKRALSRAQQMAKDPATKQKLANARQQLAGRGKKQP